MPSQDAKSNVARNNNNTWVEDEQQTNNTAALAFGSSKNNLFEMPK